MMLLLLQKQLDIQLSFKAIPIIMMTMQLRDGTIKDYQELSLFPLMILMILINSIKKLMGIHK